MYKHNSAPLLFAIHCQALRGFAQNRTLSLTAILREFPHGMQEVSGSIPLRSTSLFAFLDENPVQAICSALTGFSAF